MILVYNNKTGLNDIGFRLLVTWRQHTHQIGNFYKSTGVKKIKNIYIFFIYPSRFIKLTILRKLAFLHCLYAK